MPGCCRPKAACLAGSALERGVRRRSRRLPGRRTLEDRGASPGWALPLPRQLWQPWHAANSASRSAAPLLARAVPRRRRHRPAARRGAFGRLATNCHHRASARGLEPSKCLPAGSSRVRIVLGPSVVLFRWSVLVPECAMSRPRRALARRLSTLSPSSRPDRGGLPVGAPTTFTAALHGYPVLARQCSPATARARPVDRARPPPRPAPCAALVHHFQEPRPAQTLVFAPSNVRAEATCEVGRLWPAAENELATPLPAKGGLPRGVASRARG